jgi:alginate O-acetyltransferase complex protein AlgI
MLFNSYGFIFLFLPSALFGFLLLRRLGKPYAAMVWLTIASLYFYGYWNPAYLLLLCASILGNFALGRWIVSARPTGLAKGLLIIGLVGNLSVLAYFKYAGFIVANVNVAIGATWDVGNILLPLAISFFTFQQVAFLVDAYQGKVKEYRFVQYCLFVTFFPQLIAGPIVHHGEMLPQFSRPSFDKKRMLDLSVGLTIFSIGLFKKTILADGIAVYATPIFDSAEAGQALTLFDAWGGALAYTFQLYFDFSGYSDMAIGIARMFGIRLPMNFYSPYKSRNITEFWRRWHMTLSRFLRDYLYIPLGGNRCGNVRRNVNLLTTMLLGGLWHGAGWTFVAWGMLHGLYLVINNGWSAFASSRGWDFKGVRTYQVFSWLLTFVAVVVAWVLFRAPTFTGAMTVLEGMAGLNGVALPAGVLARLGSAGAMLTAAGVKPADGGGLVMLSTYLWISVLLAISLFAPSTQEFVRKYRPCIDFFNHFESVNNRLTWRPTPIWGAVVGVIGVVAVLGLAQVSEFLYFQF